MNKKLSEIIGLIISIHRGVLHSKTKLVKLLYLLDLKAIKKLGKTLTGVKFKSYFYGPYSDEIDEVLNYLEELGFISSIKNTSFYLGKEYIVYKLNNMPNFDALTLEEKNFIRNVIKNYKDKDLDEILMEVYSSEPFIKSEFGEEIRFEPATANR
jgi:uncharacterized protein YwgA